MRSFNPITFFRELRRRRVFRVAVLYGVGAWGVIAACDVLFPQLTDWVADPDRAMRAVFIAAILLFPIALVFGWLYDVTAEGIQRTADFSETAHDPDTSLHPVDRGVIGTLSVLVLAVLALTSVHILRMPPPVSLAGSPGASIAPENSIAVLPFEICEGPGVDPLLAAGIANEVLRHLAEIPNLKVTARSLLVIARASAFAFAETDMEPQQIASTLRVHYLLTGTVCRDGDALTVKAELVDESGYLVWTHSYTEQLDAAGQVTRSVAALLAEGVAARMGAVIPVPQEEPVDRLAYEQLLIGREYAEKDDADRARAAFEAALERKPDYAEAFFELAWLEWPNMFADSNQRAQYEKALLLFKPALAMARRDVERNPNSAQAHKVIGRIMASLVLTERNLAWREGAPEDTAGWDARLTEAEQHLRRSVELNPSDSDAWFRLYLAMEGAERDGESLLKVLEQGIERDPLNTWMNGQLAIRWAERGRYEEAVALLERFKQLPRTLGPLWPELFRISEMRGRYDLWTQTMVEMLERDGDEQWIWVVGFGPTLRRMGLTAEGEAVMTRLDGLRHQWGEDWFLPQEERERLRYEQASGMTDEEILDLSIARARAIARAIGDRGEYERAIRLWEAISHDRLASSIRIWSLWPKVNLATLYLRAGRDADAARLLEELSQILEPFVREGLRNGVTLHQLALTQALQGRVDAAIATLELSEASGNVAGLSHPECFERDGFAKGLDPWEALRPDPRFQKLLERCEMERVRQLESIRALLASRDLDQLLAPVMALAEEEKVKKRAAEGGK